MFGIENHVCCTKRTIKPVCQPIEEKAALTGCLFFLYASPGQEKLQILSFHSRGEKSVFNLKYN